MLAVQGLIRVYMTSSEELADAVGSVREVVARVLRDLRVAGIAATAADRVVILDAARLHSETWGQRECDFGRWPPLPTSLTARPGSSTLVGVRPGRTGLAGK